MNISIGAEGGAESIPTAQQLRALEMYERDRRREMIFGLLEKGLGVALTVLMVVFLKK